jgi:hypothetical protein
MIWYLLIALLAWPVNAGLLYADARMAFPGLCSCREDAGEAVALGLIFALVWPIGVFMIFCLTGFAEHGIWKWQR